MKVLILLLLLILNFVTTGFEVAYVTLSFPDIFRLTRREFYIRNPEGVLFTILAFSNLFQIAFAVVMLSLLMDFLQPEYAAFVSAMLSATVLLIVSEYLPKYIASSRPEIFFRLFEPFITFFYYLLYPINYLMYRLFRRDPEKQIYEYIEELKNKGFVDEKEANILKGAISFFRRRAEILIEPIDKFSVLDVETSLKEIRENPPSTYEILVKEKDRFVGYVYKKDLLRLEDDGRVGDVLRRSVYISSNSRIYSVVRLMKQLEVSLIFTDRGVITVESFWRGFVKHSIGSGRE